jgi:hypothetical protein
MSHKHNFQQGVKNVGGNLVPNWTFFCKTCGEPGFPVYSERIATLERRFEGIQSRRDSRMKG